MTRWRGAVIAFATRHGKAAQVGPALAPLGAAVLEVTSVDTDALGTFTGSVPRLLSPEEAARQKALAALAAAPAARFGLGSEGSFGPDPRCPWLLVDEELLLLRSRDGAVEVVVRERAAAHALERVVRSEAEVEAFAEEAGFPSHALVLDGVVGIGDLAVVRRALAVRGEVTLRSDLRAHVNPSRQAVIAACGRRLAEALAAECPACGRPGFVPSHAEPGLPCDECRTPTAAPRVWLSRCPCGMTRCTPNTARASPAECPTCNP
ncbi:MAG: DUF6671 family protein [Myxococcota bacterium]